MIRYTIVCNWLCSDNPPVSRRNKNVSYFGETAGFFGAVRCLILPRLSAVFPLV